MPTTSPPVQELFDDVKDYVVTQRNLLFTIASKKGADVFYIVITSVIFLLILWFFLILFSFAIAFGLGAWLDNLFFGFGIVALCYVLIGVIIWRFKDRLIKTPLLKLFFNLLAANKTPDYEQSAQ